MPKVNQYSLLVDARMAHVHRFRLLAAMVCHSANFNLVTHNGSTISSASLAEQRPHAGDLSILYVYCFRCCDIKRIPQLEAAT